VGYVPAHIDVHAPGLTEPRDVAFILHGLLGSASNWRGFVRQLVESHRDWLFVLVDLRNHGESAGALPPHTVAACARDLDALARDIGLEPSLVLGHSFGGKVALTYAREHAPRIDEVWLVDAPLGPIPASDPRHAQVRRLLDALKAEPILAGRRADVAARLRDQGFDEALAQWMTTNLEQRAAGLAWRFDLGAVESMLADYSELDLEDQVASPAGGPTTHVVLGARSQHLPAAEQQRLEALAGAGSIALHTVADAGHWVHVDNPTALRTLVSEALRRIGARPR